MAITISCVIYGADIRGMQVTLRCRGYSPTIFKGYGYVDDTGQIGHDLWQFRGSRSSAAMGFLEEDESRIWVMAFDTGSSYPVTNNYSASEFEDGVKKNLLACDRDKLHFQERRSGSHIASTRTTKLHMLLYAQKYSSTQEQSRHTPLLDFKRLGNAALVPSYNSNLLRTGREAGSSISAKLAPGEACQVVTPS